MIAIIALSAAAASPFNRRPGLFWPAGVLGLGLLAWLARGLTARAWPPLLKATAVALLTVELQAILGGMRVTEMSDQFAIIHGCLGQIFYCMLLLLALMSSRNWGVSPAWLPVATRSDLVRWGVALLIAVFLQLLWGATIRHLHRIGLPAPDIITTNGRFFPGVENPAAFFFFLHKVWAALVAILGLILAWRARRSLPLTREHQLLLRLALGVITLVAIQIVLGVAVVLTTTSFWVTNFHVFNGLAILACTFAFVVKVVAAKPQRGMLATAPVVQAQSA